MHNLIQPLESRRLLSGVVPFPPFPLNITNEAVHEYADVSQTIRVGYMPKANVGHISQLHGDINWGDGTITPAGFARDKSGGIDIVAAHAYAKPGTFAITGTFTLTPWAPPGQPLPQYILLLGSVNTTAKIDATPAQLTETAGKTFTATLGKFHQPTLDIFFTAQINWGDGVTTTATITGGDLAQGNWQITGTHYYQHAGTYKVYAQVYSHIAPNGKAVPAQDFFTLIHVV